MTDEGRVSSTLGWFRTAKDKFRTFAYGEQSEPRERPRVGLALAGGFARGIAPRCPPRFARSWNSHRLRGRHERRSTDRRGLLRGSIAGTNGQGWHIHKLHGFRALDAVLARTSHQPAHGKIYRAFY